VEPSFVGQKSLDWIVLKFPIRHSGGGDPQWRCSPESMNTGQF
jgi:hypothetical protein